MVERFANYSRSRLRYLAVVYRKFRSETCIHVGMAKQQAADLHLDAGNVSKKNMFTLIRRSVGFIGCGQMAFAIANGFIQAGVCSPSDIIASSPNELPNRVRFAQLGCHVSSWNIDVIRKCSIVIIATKPYAVEQVLAEIAGELQREREILLVSIAAGVKIERMQAVVDFRLGGEFALKIVRAVPNMPMQLGPGWGACCLSCGPNVSVDEANYCVNLFGSIAGKCAEIPESLDTATALIGSGPAFVFVLIEALADGAVMEGLPRDLALSLASQMVMGSAKMLTPNSEGGDVALIVPPSVLKDKICSPGGTTIAGIYALEKGGYRAAVMSAVRAATERARELGK